MTREEGLEPRSGQAVVFRLTDGRQVEVAIAGATSVRTFEHTSGSRIELTSALGRSLSHLDLAALLKKGGQHG